jgi:tetratricopeptide (TPR) repeat protein
MVVATLAMPSLRPGVLDPSVGSARVRVLIWQGATTLLRDSGWHLWTGHGQESLRALFPRYYVAEIGRLEGTDAMPDRAHNELLDTLTTSGIVGALLELFMFAVACRAALKIAEPRLSAGVAGAIVVHFIEIQFGVATVVTRLALLATVAIVVGKHYELSAVVTPRIAIAPSKRSRLASRGRQSGDGVAWWIALAALAGAAAPLLFVLPGALTALRKSGTVSEFLEYLRWQSYGSVIVYVALAGVSVLIANRVDGRDSDAARPLAAAAWIPVAVAISVQLALTPSRADIVARAATGFEQQRQWQEAAIAFEEARRLQPAVAPYADGMGRTLSQGAVNLQGELRARAMDRARDAFSAAIDLAPHDADYARHLASLLRLEAWSRSSSPEQRDARLREADDIYRGATQRSPELTSLWVEWARVDLDRRRASAAVSKLDRALQLDNRRADALAMRAEAEALPAGH